MSSMTATIVENADSSVTGTINTTEYGRGYSRNFTSGSLLGGYLIMRDATGYTLVAEVDEKGNLQGQLLGGSEYETTTFTLTPSH